jgi:hypothetical protein
MPSLMPCCGFAICVLLAGCTQGPRFVQIAAGVNVSQESIEQYAEQHGLSRDEAKRRLAAELTSGDPRREAMALDHAGVQQQNR